jgi:hypothetical protein
MKNIHILPTENSSRLSYNKDGVLELHRLQWRKNTQNIYITSYEEIKERDYVICDNKLYKIIVTGVLYNDDFTLQTDIEGVFLNPKYCSKIILTTDQDLIKDGVQAIDDDSVSKILNINDFEYRIIPKEGMNCWSGKKGVEGWSGKEEPKQETLEEAAINCWAEGAWDNRDDFTDGFIEGAKWQQEQDKKRYSEEEVLKQLNIMMTLPSSTLDKFTDNNGNITMKWFEQNKKK